MSFVRFCSAPYEAQLDLIALASGEYLDSGTVSSGARNWLYKWRAIIDTL